MVLISKSFGRRRRRGVGGGPPLCYFKQQAKATNEKPAITPALQTYANKRVANI